MQSSNLPQARAYVIWIEFVTNVVNSIETKGGSLETRHASCTWPSRSRALCAVVFWVGSAHGRCGGLCDGNGYCSLVKKAKRSTGDALRWRERRSVWRWSKKRHAPCAWTSHTRALHGAACGSALSWLPHGRRANFQKGHRKSLNKSLERDEAWWCCRWTVGPPNSGKTEPNKG